MTRLRNPESKLSQLKNQQVAAAVHEANKGFKEGKEVIRTQMILLFQKMNEKIPETGAQDKYEITVNHIEAPSVTVLMMHFVLRAGGCTIY